MFFFSFLNSNAQSTFYINPKVGAAFSFTSAASAADLKTKYTPFGGTITGPYSLSKNFNFLKNPTMLRGLGLGIVLNNKRHKFELEWEKSAISYKVETFFLDYRYAESIFYFFSTKINEKTKSLYVNYAYHLTKNPAKTSIWLKVAPGISLSSMFELYTGKNYYNTLLTPNVRIDYINFHNLFLKPTLLQILKWVLMSISTEKKNIFYLFL